MTANQKMAKELHRLADQIAANDVPLPSWTLRVHACLESRADVQQWADHLGTEVKLGGTAATIPYAERRIPIEGHLALEVSVQGPEEQDPRKAALEARIAELEAKLAEGGAK